MTTLKTTLKPFEDRVIIDPDEAPKMTESGLYIPENAQEKMKPNKGTVVSVGPGKLADDRNILYLILQELRKLNGKEESKEEFLKIPLQPGQRVMYGPYAGTPVEDPETKKIFLVMRFTDCFCEE